MTTNGKKKQTSNQLSALSRLFSPRVFRELATKGRSALLIRLLAQTGLPLEHLYGETLSTVFDTAFAVLRKAGVRNEYVYRAALTRNILLGKHSLNTASMLAEFRAGTCKADLVILNGTSTVYEIKSDRDSLSRLNNQILNYKRVFSRIYVVASDTFIQEILDSTPNDIGVMSLARWNRIRTVRKALDRSDYVCPVTIFESLRLAEAKSILRELRVPIPDVPNTMLHESMRRCFETLDPVQVHDQMVKTLKTTRNLASLGQLIDQLPTSLQPAALSINVGKADHQCLVEAVRTPLYQALHWAQ